MSELTIEQFVDKMDEIMPVVGREFVRRHIGDICKGKITIQQLMIMDILYRDGDTKMSDLAKSMAVTTAAMTGLVERLVRDGYLQRAFDDGDRRIVMVRLNKAGRDLTTKLNMRRRSANVKIFGEVSAKDREDYLRVLVKIKDILLKEREK